MTTICIIFWNYKADDKVCSKELKGIDDILYKSRPLIQILSTTSLSKPNDMGHFNAAFQLLHLGC